MTERKRIGKTKKRMRCAEELLHRRTFVYIGAGDWECVHCGFCQSSTAEGCAQHVGSQMIVWHRMDTFHRFRRIAVRGGFKNLPEAPVNFET